MVYKYSGFSNGCNPFNRWNSQSLESYPNTFYSTNIIKLIKENTGNINYI